MGFGDIGGSSILGKALNFLGSNFSIKLQPRWKSSDTSAQKVTITVNLFNDTLEHAVANYIMVTNLTANAMSLQYGLYTSSVNMTANNKVASNPPAIPISPDNM